MVFLAMGLCAGKQLASDSTAIAAICCFFHTHSQVGYTLNKVQYEVRNTFTRPSITQFSIRTYLSAYQQYKAEFIKLFLKKQSGTFLLSSSAHKAE